MSAELGGDSAARILQVGREWVDISRPAGICVSLELSGGSQSSVRAAIFPLCSLGPGLQQLLYKGLLFCLVSGCQSLLPGSGKPELHASDGSGELGGKVGTEGRK